MARVWNMNRRRVACHVVDKRPPVQSMQLHEQDAEARQEFPLLLPACTGEKRPHHLPWDPLHNDERLAKGRVGAFQYMYGGHGIARLVQVPHAVKLMRCLSVCMVSWIET